MSNALEEYRQAQATVERLRPQIKNDLIARFNELLMEAIEIQRELKEQFGTNVKISGRPPKVRRRRTEEPKKVAGRRGRTAKVAPAASESSPANRKINALERRLDGQKKKLEGETDPKRRKAIEDRIYEIQDELRLAKEA